MLRRPSPLWVAVESKPGPSSRTSRRSSPLSAVRWIGDAGGRSGVLGGVLQRLQAAVVDGRLDLGRIAADAPARDRRRAAGALRPTARSAGTSPRSASTLGKMPWASSRSSSIAPSTSRSSSPSRALATGSSASLLAGDREPDAAVRSGVAGRRRAGRARVCAARPRWRRRSAARDCCSSRSESFHASLEFGVLLREQGDRAGRLEQLGLLGELGVVDDRRRRLPVALDLGQHPARSRVRRAAARRRRPRRRGPAAPEPEPQPRVAERLAQHRLELAQAGRCSDSDHHAPQHPPGEQLAPRSARAGTRTRSRLASPTYVHLGDRGDGAGLDLQQRATSVGDLRQQEDDRDRCADHECAAARRRAGQKPPDDASRPPRAPPAITAARPTRSVDHQRRLGGDEQRRSRGRPPRSRRSRTGWRSAARTARARDSAPSDAVAPAARISRSSAALEAAGREREDERQREDVDHALPQDPECEQPPARLDDCRMYGTPPGTRGDQQRPERSMPAAAAASTGRRAPGPRMMSAFCAASQPGYARKSARSVTQTASAAAATPRQDPLPRHAGMGLLGHRPR